MNVVTAHSCEAMNLNGIVGVYTLYNGTIS